jgi:2',3'-cyclic-nucleotide 2'-phosphodiesterase / 3'-nucleotidase / 5'-nucleotidase
MKNRGIFLILTLIALIAITVPPGVIGAAQEQNTAGTDATVSFTILHTNDFHGNLQLSGSNPGMARVAYKINEIAGEVGISNLLLLDAGDIMQGTLLSNLFYGASTIDVYNSLHYDAATFGNHEFDWSQTTLISRTEQAEFPFISSNIVISDTGSCDTAGWDSPSWTVPWITRTVGTAPDTAIVGILGVTTQETPYITLAGNTAGLCFKDPANSISHYYDAVVNAGADVIVVLSHLGNTDGGYGYGFPVYGDQTLAQRLIDASTPVNLIIGGHSHTDLTEPQIIGGTYVVQAHYGGRKLNRADISVDTDTNQVTITWTRNVIAITDPEDPDTVARINIWANDPWYQHEINRVVGFTNVEITRNYNGDSLMGDFVDDAIYNDLNNDAFPENDVDMVFNNAGGLRADITFPITTTLPVTLTHGMLYSVLPFGNATVVGDIPGSRLLELLNQSAALNKGAIQVAGIRYDFYCYGTADPCTNAYAWGAYNVEVFDRDLGDFTPLDINNTYRIATNEFLAPAGQDMYYAFKYVTNVSYWGDMLDGVERWVTQEYTHENPYDGTLDGRIVQNGTFTYDPTDPTQIVPVTILHHNDDHGNTDKGAYVGYTQLATLINQYRAENPERTLLLNAGDVIQGDAMAYFFKAAFTGFGADGSPLDPSLQVNPIIAELNAMDYTAMTLGNHEFNFGKDVFTGTLGQATFPILGANIIDDGQYGLADVNVRPYITVTVPGPDGEGEIDIAILGIANHRVPNYELPSNILGLTFTNPIEEAAAQVPALEETNDAVVALTHIGFTTNPASVEVDNNVDTYLAENVSGIDAIIGGHSHTNPSPTANDSSRGDYKYLPAITIDPMGDPVIINQAYRYNSQLGMVSLGFLPDGNGGYDLITRAGSFIPVSYDVTAEDPAIDVLITPYTTRLSEYTNTPIGETLYPLDALQGYTQETNAANLQADSAVWELAQHDINVDFYLSGAMSNKKIADTATPEDPFPLLVSHMFTLMPYENSLVTLNLNGPQLKTLLERGYRNYYYYKHVPGYGGYSYYTTCMLDINSVGQITYRDVYPRLPDGNNVLSLTINGVPIDFTNADTYYHVATVNYLAAGSCNFNDAGQTLWPLDQIVYDTQYYVRDSVINYIMDQVTISPTIEGRLNFISITNFLFLPLMNK